MDMAYGLISGLFGPASPVPWWAWAAALVMIFWGLLVPGARDSGPAPVEDAG